MTRLLAPRVHDRTCQTYLRLHDVRSRGCCQIEPYSSASYGGQEDFDARIAAERTYHIGTSGRTQRAIEAHAAYGQSIELGLENVKSLRP